MRTPIVNRKNLFFLLAALLIGVLLGLFVISPLLRGIDRTTAEPMTFSAAGLQITLTEDFNPDHTAEGFDACYLSPEAAVFALREPFDLTEGFGELTAAEYGALVLESNPSAAGAVITEQDGLLCFTYEADADGDTFFYFNTLHKTDDAFWQVCFAVPADLAEEHRDEIVNWAKSIRFAD